MSRTLLAAYAATLCALAVSPAGASAAEMKAKLRLTSSQPSSPAGAILNLDRPEDDSGKPKTERIGVFRLPRGAVISHDAVPACLKDDTEWQLEGPDACPDSFVGTGWADVYSGFGSPLDPIFSIDQQFYYAPGELVALYTYSGTKEPVGKVARASIADSRTVVARLDLPPGWPPGSEVSPDKTRVTINRYVGPRGAFITTPPTCPRSRKWITTVTLYYADGTRDSVRDATPCRRVP